MAQMRAGILVIEEKRDVTNLVSKIFKSKYGIFSETSYQKALKTLQGEEIKLVLIDQNMFQRDEALTKFKEMHPDTIIYSIAEYAEMDLSLGLLKDGKIHNFIEKPFSDDVLKELIEEGMRLYDEAKNQKKLVDREINAAAERVTELADYKDKASKQIDDLNAKLKSLEGEKQKAQNDVKILQDQLKTVGDSIVRVDKALSKVTKEEEERYSIMVVDDEVVVTKALYRLLSKKFNVITANSGAEALEKLKENKVHLMITDQRMPALTGIELARKVSEEYPDIICFLLTGYTDIEVAIEAVNVGYIKKYINKPFDNEKLSQLVEQGLVDYERGVVQRKILEEGRDIIADRIEELIHQREQDRRALDKLKEESTKDKERLQNQIKNGLTRIRDLENELKKANDKVKRLTEENNSLKNKLKLFQQRWEELAEESE